MGRRYNRGISDAQADANADALANRGRTYADPNAASFTVSWNYHNRQPTTLSEAVDMIRQAYADEVPTKLHEGADSLSEGGTPEMHPRFVAYLDDDDQAGVERKTDHAALDYMKTPFRGTLASYEPNRAKIVEHVAIGSMGPMQAAIEEGIPNWCARLVAEDTLFGFLRNLSDVKVAIAKRTSEAA